MLPSSSSPKPLPTHPLNLLHFPLCLAGDLLVTRCSVFTLVTESCSFSCPLCSSLWLFFLLPPSFTASAWIENWSVMKFLPNLLRQNTFCFKKCIFLLPSAICFSCSRSSPSSSQSARSGLTCHKVFTGSCCFSRPLYYSNPGQSLALHLYLPFFCLLTATSLSNNLFHPASIESSASTHLV